MKPNSKTAHLKPNHDQYFQECFSDPVSAAGLVRLAAPPEVVEQLDLNHLVALPTERFDPDMGKRVPDLLFECPTKAGKILVSLLFEHKSSPSSEIALQLMRYILMEHELRLQSKSQPPTMVLPIIIYNGTRGWNPRLTLVPTKNVPVPLQTYLLKVPALILNLNYLEDDEIEDSFATDAQGFTAILALKHAFSTHSPQRQIIEKLQQKLKLVVP